MPRTFIQYCDDVRSAKREEYGISVADAQEFYPDHVLRPEWVQGLIKHAESGGEFTPAMIRTLSDDERYAINKLGYSFTRYI